MSEQYVCKKCGGSLDIAITVYAAGIGDVAEDGSIVIYDEQKPFVGEVNFIQCEICGAFDEETGWTVVKSPDALGWLLRPVSASA